MKLFPRKAEDHWPELLRDKAWAHAILDLWVAGEKFDKETIRSALRITGDLLA